MSHHNDNSKLRSMRVTPPEIDAMLDRLDEGAPSRASCKRQHERYAFRQPSILVRMQQPGAGAPTPFVMPTRNISAGGISLLHGGFVHAGTYCWINLTTKSGERTEIEGVVVHCRYIEKNVHEVAVRFEEEIEPDEFCDVVRKKRIVLLMPDNGLAKLVMHHLTALGCTATLESAKSPQPETLGRFDCAIVGVDRTDADGRGIAAALRDAGFGGLIAALGADAAELFMPGDPDSVFDQGVSLPPRPDVLASLIESIAEEPIRSTFEDDESMHDLINTFVNELPERVGNLESALESNDLDTVDSIVRNLKAEAGGYGFPSVVSAAEQIETIRKESEQVDALAQQIQELNKLCALARGPRKRAKTDAVDSASDDDSSSEEE